ncbi:magnesium-translocating P-type ATPase [Caproiciproducens galactitolivorans]|uniref:Magnesium-transporting ATPase, P-type 1 n=1 Tax=Caproiciproducens galactitolivorans TaxID=642589 RepID=A0A4Z0YG54_9FIRM|nr:magnesium-translocating P-type ATPase [Caproiciproducens galactitolivorans]QEY34521.1 magnesium-translocating P-type ATPase [Caproiciproducens galactitolivorans]TGJ77693.1 magnesium-transporting ATPase, P-type 1 [Caproiciproducens galactitolivorans]
MKKTQMTDISAQAIAKKLKEYSNMEKYILLSTLKTREKGLDIVDVEMFSEQYGSNEISHEKPKPWYIQLIKAFENPFTFVLLVIAAISFITEVELAKPEERSPAAVIVILTLVLISGGLRFFQEFRSGKEAESLKSMVKTTATVIRRENGREEIPMADLLPGDIVVLAGGDMIPADLRILKAKDLFISQSALTGESEPIEKFSDPDRTKKEDNLFDLRNICFMGTNVVSGSALAVVLATGDNTYFGNMARALSGERAPTSFDKGVNSVSFLMIRFMLVMVPVVFLLNGLTKHNWIQALLFAISVAIGLTPEMLPTIVTTNLAKGAVSMSRQKTVVKHLNSIQNFGAMDILCTDKTGTLTRDEIVIERHLNVQGIEDQRVLKYAYLNSYFQTGLKNLIDLAVIDKANEESITYLNNEYIKVDEIPFDFARRRMSVVLKNREGKTQVITKGAVEEILQICSCCEYQGEVLPLTEELRRQVVNMAQELNSQGMRVIAVAQKRDPSVEGVFGVKDESDMTLMGYLGLLDPPKKSAAAAISALGEYGVQVKVLTGDNEGVTRKICGDVGLSVDKILLGSEIEEMSEEELMRQAGDTTVFAKLSPMQKARVVNALQEIGHTVGFMGDGINDAQALSKADVGISVDTAVDIAKESADIILLEKDLMVLEHGVIEGRKIFGNIIKYIKMTSSSNFGNMLSMLVASAFLPFLPMMPVQILVLDLLYNISQISIPWDNMDVEYLCVPRKWDATSIGKFMLCIGPVSSVFDIATYLLMWFVFGCNTATNPALIALFNAGWFVESLLSQTLIIHLIRTPKLPFVQSRAATPVVLLTSVIMAIGILIPFTPLGAYVGLASLPMAYFGWLAVIILGYITFAQIVKMIYIKINRSWL